MRKIIFLLLIIALFFVGCTIPAPEKDYSTYTDEELIFTYYTVETDLEEALIILGLEARKKVRGSARGFTGGFSIGIIRVRIRTLGDEKAAILTEIYKRGMRLPR